MNKASFKEAFLYFSHFIFSKKKASRLRFYSALKHAYFRTKSTKLIYYWYKYPAICFHFDRLVVF